MGLIRRLSKGIWLDERPLIGQDPYIISYSNEYLLIESQDEKRITISFLKDLQSPQRTYQTIVWENRNEHQVWSPELHLIDNAWHIFYSYSNGENRTHRTYMLRSNSGVFGPYLPVGRIGPNIWGIDQTTFKYGKHHFFVWSGWHLNSRVDQNQNLYIARDDDLQTRILIASPTLDWEGSILEGPQYHNSRYGIGLTYSANASWTQDYSTGILYLTGDPLLPSSWIKESKPLARNVGHGHQILDTDSTNPLFAYHRKLSPMPGWADRSIEIKPISEI